MRGKGTLDVEYEAPTWNLIHRLTLRLAKEILASGFQPDIIVGVSRGGWLPARVLSDLLENPNLASVKTESYLQIGRAQGVPELTQCLNVEATDKRVLVVDDIADTGESLSLVRDHVQERKAIEIQTATLYHKRRSAFKPDYFGKETDCWVVFPWEHKETVGKILQAHHKNPASAQRELTKLAGAGVPKRLITRFQKEFTEAKKC
jgi:uncharacterized protein